MSERLVATFSRAALLAIAMLAFVTPAHADDDAGSITNVLSDLCLDPGGGQVREFAPVVQSKCDKDKSQQWILKEGRTGTRVITAKKELCLDIEGRSTRPGARVIVTECRDDAGQQWRLVPSGAGYQAIMVRSGLCLAIAGDSQARGAQAIQQQCSTATARLWQLDGLISAASTKSKWSNRIDLPLIPVSAANLPDGRVLLWAADAPTFFSAVDQGRTYSAYFDPGSERVSQRIVTETGHDMFCPGLNLLPDGTVMVTGGLSSGKTSLFNPLSNVWSIGPALNISRGYHGSVTLSNGGAFTIGGSWSGDPAADKAGEVWSAATGWRGLPNFNSSPITGPDPEGRYRGDNHAWLFATGGGRVFHAGPSAAMHWIDTSGGGSISGAGNRGDDPYSMTGNAVMYDIGKILKVGGAPAYVNAPASAGAYAIDINGGVSVRKLASMAYARTFSNSVVLPNGQVVVVGGQTFAKQNSDDGTVLPAELWDPAKEKFTTLAAMTVPRAYHSVALLLPDGRVFAAGGGLCGDCTANHPNAEILSPPYLFNPDGERAERPEIKKAPDGAPLGAEISVRTKQAIKSFSLVRLSSATHALNNDQRRIPLQFDGENDRKDDEGSQSYQVQIPSDAGVVVPGYYMLFALNRAGVPSVAKIIRIGS